jgi:hypothetical protein
MLYEAATTYLLFGSLVSSVGVAMVIWHVLQHRVHQDDGSLSRVEQRFFEQQYRRRMQTSALAVTLGALIGLLGYIPALESSPIFATSYVMGLLLLSLWLILLALSDAIASRVNSNRANRRQRQLRDSLHEALMELKSVNDVSMHHGEYDASRETN